MYISCEASSACSPPGHVFNLAGTPQHLKDHFGRLRFPETVVKEQNSWPEHLQTHLGGLHFPETTELENNSWWEQKVLILSDGANRETVRANVRESGGFITHEFPGKFMIGYYSMETPPAGVSEVLNGIVSEDKLATFPPETRFLLEVWNGLLQQPVPTGQNLFSQKEHIPHSDTTIDESAQAALRAGKFSQTVPGPFQTSEYFAGTIVANVVLPESIGPASTEDWTEDLLRLVYIHTVNSGEWWRKLAPSYAPVNWVWEFFQPSIDVEPINFARSQEGVWIGKSMTVLGFPNADYMSAVRDLINAQRNRYATHWGLGIFVANSENDPNGTFADNSVAWAYLRGPLYVMSSDNGEYGNENLAPVGAHEEGHIFDAQDQSIGALKPCNGAPSGVFGVLTRNSEYPTVNTQERAQIGCPPLQDSIMRGGDYPFWREIVDDNTTFGQMGAQDAWQVDCQSRQWVEGPDGMGDALGAVCLDIIEIVKGDRLTGTAHLFYFPDAWAQRPIPDIEKFVGIDFKGKEGLPINPIELQIAPSKDAMTYTVPIAGQPFVQMRPKLEVSNVAPKAVWIEPPKNVYLPVVTRGDMRLHNANLQGTLYQRGRR